MTEHVPEHTPPDPQVESQGKASPPPPPSPPDATESDLKLSRKREREVSLEPATPKAEVIEVEPGTHDNKDRRTPAKKNKIQLDTTEEEEDVAPGTRTPPSHPPTDLSISPPHEIKVRLIRQGVEDLNWQNPLTAAVADMEDPTSANQAEVGAEDLLSPETPADATAAAADLAALPDSADSTRGSVMGLHGDEPESGLSPANAQAPVGRLDSDSDGAEKEKGLKRKFGARAISGGLSTCDVGVEHLKRQRDDPDKDDNPRETKRPSPPPEASPPPTREPSTGFKLSGFMAYASTSSPFASVKGRNIFKKKSPSLPSLPSFPSSPPQPTPPSTLDTQASTASTSTPRGSVAPLKSEATEIFSGFDASLSARSSSFSPVRRPRSPPPGSASGSRLGGSKSPTRRGNSASANAFSSYATGGVQGFHVPKRARAISPSGGSSRSSMEVNSTLHVSSFNEASDSGAEDEEDKAVGFGEKLRAGKDDDNDGDSDDEKGKLVLTEQEITTGEEDEMTLYQVRGKLFSLSPQNQWSERGTGLLKLNARRYDGGGARLVMRREAVYTLLLNFALFRGMRCFLAQDPRYLRFSIIENGATTHYNLRVASAKVGQELLEEINANIPT